MNHRLIDTALTVITYTGIALYALLVALGVTR
jgi:hypothetical protein